MRTSSLNTTVASAKQVALRGGQRKEVSVSEVAPSVVSIAPLLLGFVSSNMANETQQARSNEDVFIRMTTTPTQLDIWAQRMVPDLLNNQPLTKVNQELHLRYQQPTEKKQKAKLLLETGVLNETQTQLLEAGMLGEEQFDYIEKELISLLGTPAARTPALPNHA